MLLNVVHIKRKHLNDIDLFSDILLQNNKPPRPPPPAPKNSSQNSKRPPPERPPPPKLTTRSSSKDIDDEDEGFRPVNIDANLVKNMLASYGAQQGLPGPATNILSSMGIQVKSDSNVADINGSK